MRGKIISILVTGRFMDDLSEASKLFYKFDRAKEALIELVSQGIGIRNVIESCSSNLLLDGAA